MYKNYSFQKGFLRDPSDKKLLNKLLVVLANGIAT